MEGRGPLTKFDDDPAEMLLSGGHQRPVRAADAGEYLSTSITSCSFFMSSST